MSRGVKLMASTVWQDIKMENKRKPVIMGNSLLNGLLIFASQLNVLISSSPLIRHNDNTGEAMPPPLPRPLGSLVPLEHTHRHRDELPVTAQEGSSCVIFIQSAGDSNFSHRGTGNFLA